ncbi:OLC1v1031227C1 [Oldenlandia corymbosa var. corymbosa]|uniref:OLC1v1031227C1 n=1 Tax=Oldenlandia corymbosa var. corymbosa TaxID=529605 RepID=A0AAV1CI08_OLDCO|nr:OLC1v1031227C1 [Oldenlandia corymbosa var. corymbosa]
MEGLDLNVRIDSNSSEKGCDYDGEGVANVVEDVADWEGLLNSYNDLEEINDVDHVASSIVLSDDRSLVEFDDRVSESMKGNLIIFTHERTKWECGDERTKWECGDANNLLDLSFWLKARAKIAKSSISSIAIPTATASSLAGVDDYHFPADLIFVQDRKDEALAVLKSELVAALNKEVKSLDEHGWMFEGPGSRIHLISKPGGFLQKKHLGNSRHHQLPPSK